MAQVREGELSGKGKRFGIVVSRFNEHVTKQLLEGALNFLRRAGVSESDIHVNWVPGAFEIPVALKVCIDSNRPDGLIALGCVIRGETSNYEHIAQSVTDQIAGLTVTYNIPIGFGVLTVESLDQALQRSGGKYGNKGREAAESVIEMANLISKLSQSEEPGKLLETTVRKWRPE